MSVKVLEIEVLRVGRADLAVLVQEDKSMSMRADKTLDLISEGLIVRNWDHRFSLRSDT